MIPLRPLINFNTPLLLFPFFFCAEKIVFFGLCNFQTDAKNGKKNTLRHTYGFLESIYSIFNPENPSVSQ